MEGYPVVRQETPYSCGAACLKSLLCYYGLPVEEWECREACETTRRLGTSPENLLGGSRSLGKPLNLRFWGRSAWSLKRLQEYLPAIVLLQMHDGGHYCVLYDLNHSDAFLMDPAIGDYTRMSLWNFRRNWIDWSAQQDGRVYQRWALVSVD